jgi:hypothetical protein
MNGAFEIQCRIAKACATAYSAMRFLWLRADTGSPVADIPVVS